MASDDACSGRRGGTMAPGLAEERAAHVRGDRMARGQHKVAAPSVRATSSPATKGVLYFCGFYDRLLRPSSLRAHRSMS